MIMVPLSQDRFALIDDQDADLLAFKWHANEGGRTFYATRNVTVGGRRTAVKMHRVIGERMGIVGHVDHKNRGGLDNRRCNLREASRSQNSANRNPYVSNSSGFKGVCWHRQHRKWVARITINGKKRHLGLFIDPRTAAMAYDAAARDAYGEFAAPNFPASTADANDQRRRR